MKHESKYLMERRERMLKIKPDEPAKKKPAPIKKRSDRGKKDDRELAKIKKEMLNESIECELQTPVCIHVATTLHHVKRRGVNLLNKKYLKRCCEPCNGYVEQHPQYALDHGLSISVHKI